MIREKDAMNEKDSDDNDNLQHDIELKMRKTGQVPQFIRNS